MTEALSLGAGRMPAVASEDKAAAEAAGAKGDAEGAGATEGPRAAARRASPFPRPAAA